MFLFLKKKTDLFPDTIDVLGALLNDVCVGFSNYMFIGYSNTILNP
jgi:hypothetical protein